MMLPLERKGVCCAMGPRDKPEDDICAAVVATNSVGGEERTAHKWCQTRRV